jgi:hypothetical protein
MLMWYAFIVLVEPYKLSTGRDIILVLFFKNRSSSFNGVTAMAGEGADTDVNPQPCT